MAGAERKWIEVNPWRNSPPRERDRRRSTAQFPTSGVVTPRYYRIQTCQEGSACACQSRITLLLSLKRNGVSANMSSQGSLTKEHPLSTLDQTILLIRPGMTYADLRRVAAEASHPDAAAIVANRFLLIKAGRIAYDGFLSLLETNDISSPFVRKTMYLTWCWRDLRLRSFIREVVADKSGRWQPEALMDKSQASFFEKWFKPPSARKVRSNIEHFFTETRILDPRSGTISLGEDIQDWLQVAMRVAAQHEPNRQRQLRMLQNPAFFLIQENLNSLADFTSAFALTNTDLITTSTEELLDDQLDADRSIEDEGRTWSDRNEISFAKTAASWVDPSVELERAQSTHLMLERILAKRLRERGIVAKATALIDEFFIVDEVTVLVEIKSCTDLNMRHQVRRGIAQLLEYRFLYRKSLNSHAVMLLLLLGTAPPRALRWVIEFARTQGIVVGWHDYRTERLLTSRPVPHALSGFFEVS